MCELYREIVRVPMVVCVCWVCERERERERESGKGKNLRKINNEIRRYLHSDD